MKILEVTGAYGRIATRADWEAGLDFKIINGPYLSIRDLPRLREPKIYDEIEFLYMGKMGLRRVEFTVKI